MNLLFAFAPFIAFAVLHRFIGSAGALSAAAVLSLALVLRDALAAGRHVKLLEIGSLLLFGGLAVLALVTGASWPVLNVRLWIDLGLCGIVLASIVAGRPFTLPYAKERVPAEFWGTERFLRTNRILSLAWFLAFAAIVVADVAMLYVPGTPVALGVGVTVAAIVAASKFSSWYPDRRAESTSSR